MNIITIKSSQLPKQSQELLIIPAAGGRIPNTVKKVNKILAQELQEFIADDHGFKNIGSCLVIKPKASAIAKRIAVINIGNKKTYSDLYRLFKKLNTTIANYKSVGFLAADKAAARSFIKSTCQGIYEFPHFKTDAKPAVLETVTIIGDNVSTKDIAAEQALQEAIVFTKHLGNLPANKLTPIKFAEHVEKKLQDTGVAVTVIDEYEMMHMGMGGVLAVSKGSEEEARLIILDYNPKTPSSSAGKKKTIGLVGKGVTFDSGGMSMKLAKDMDEMKYDMCGGATVAGVIMAAAALKVPYRLVGIIGAVENLPSGSAVKPRDVITMYSGKTVEVVNTDAEGRLVLADCLTYLQKYYEPKVILDIATLTGAVIKSLGNKISGILGNNEALIKTIVGAGKTVGEEIWPLPLYAGYNDELKSKVADLANLGNNRWDAIIAALFLQNFVDPSIPWVHLDIAGTAWNSEGATGTMVSTLVKLLTDKKI